jgi:hypothetical protein
MTPTARHRTVEAHFRSLASARGLDPPDAVEYRPHGVAFIWNGQQVVVEVDFADMPAEPPVRRPRARSARRPE